MNRFLHRHHYESNSVMNTMCILILMVLFATGHSYTEVFSIAKDSDDSTYYVGNRDSNFFIAKRDSQCTAQWTSTEGSATGDDDNDENREIFYDVIIGSDGLLYAAGTTKGNFSSPADEVPTLDAAVAVYNATDGSLVRQAQYDIESGLDNVARAIAEKTNGNMLVAVYGSVPNVQNTAVFETTIIEVSRDTLEVVMTYSVEVTTSDSIFSITAGPRIWDFAYIESLGIVAAVGQILGRGMLFTYNLTSGTVISQTEWGNTLGNMQVGGFVADGSGTFYVTGSSSSNVLSNVDLDQAASSEYHTFVIRFDNLLSGQPIPTWVRQLAGSGSSQSGNGVTIDPVTGEVVVVGSFDADFSVTDSQTSKSFALSTMSDDGLTDIFVWYLNSENGDFTDLRISSFASTASEDRANAVEVLSTRRLEIGGVINDGTDDNALACDDEHLTASSSPSPSNGAFSSPSLSNTVIPSNVPVSSQTPASTPSIQATEINFVSMAPTPGLSITPTNVIALPSATPSISLTPSLRASGIVLSLISSTPSTITTPDLISATSTVSSSPTPQASIVFLDLISPTPSASATSAPRTSTVSLDLMSSTPSTSPTSTPRSSSVSLDLISSTPSTSPTSTPRSSPVSVDLMSSTPSTTPTSTPQTSVVIVDLLSPTPLASPTPSPRTSIVIVDLASPTPSPNPTVSPRTSIVILDLISPTPSASPTISPRTSIVILDLITPTPSVSISPGIALGLISPTPTVSTSPTPRTSGIVLSLISSTPSVTPVRETTSISLRPSGTPFVFDNPDNSFTITPEVSQLVSPQLTTPPGAVTDTLDVTPLLLLPPAPSPSVSSPSPRVTTPSGSPEPTPSLDSSLPSLVSELPSLEPSVSPGFMQSLVATSSSGAETTKEASSPSILGPEDIPSPSQLPQVMESTATPSSPPSIFVSMSPAQPAFTAMFLAMIISPQPGTTLDLISQTPDSSLAAVESSTSPKTTANSFISHTPSRSAPLPIRTPSPGAAVIPLSPAPFQSGDITEQSISPGVAPISASEIPLPLSEVTASATSTNQGFASETSTGTPDFGSSSPQEFTSIPNEFERDEGISFISTSPTMVEASSMPTPSTSLIELDAVVSPKVDTSEVAQVIPSPMITPIAILTTISLSPEKLTSEPLSTASEEGEVVDHSTLPLITIEVSSIPTTHIIELEPSASIIPPGDAIQESSSPFEKFTLPPNLTEPIISSPVFFSDPVLPPVMASSLVLPEPIQLVKETESLSTPTPTETTYPDSSNEVLLITPSRSFEATLDSSVFPDTSVEVDILVSSTPLMVMSFVFVPTLPFIDASPETSVSDFTSTAPRMSLQPSTSAALVGIASKSPATFGSTLPSTVPSSSKPVVPQLSILPSDIPETPADFVSSSPLPIIASPDGTQVSLDGVEFASSPSMISGSPNASGYLSGAISPSLLEASILASYEPIGTPFVSMGVIFSIDSSQAPEESLSVHDTPEPSTLPLVVPSESVASLANTRDPNLIETPTQTMNEMNEMASMEPSEFLGLVSPEPSTLELVPSINSYLTLPTHEPSAEASQIPSSEGFIPFTPESMEAFRQSPTVTEPVSSPEVTRTTFVEESSALSPRPSLPRVSPSVSQVPEESQVANQSLPFSSRTPLPLISVTTSSSVSATPTLLQPSVDSTAVFTQTSTVSSSSSFSASPTVSSAPTQALSTQGRELPSTAPTVIATGLSASPILSSEPSQSRFLTPSPVTTPSPASVPIASASFTPMVSITPAMTGSSSTPSTIASVVPALPSGSSVDDRPSTTASPISPVTSTPSSSFDGIPFATPSASQSRGPLEDTNTSDSDPIPLPNVTELGSTPEITVLFSVTPSFNAFTSSSVSPSVFLQRTSTIPTPTLRSPLPEDVSTTPVPSQQIPTPLISTLLQSATPSESPTTTPMEIASPTSQIIGPTKTPTPTAFPSSREGPTRTPTPLSSPSNQAVVPTKTPTPVAFTITSLPSASSAASRIPQVSFLPPSASPELLIETPFPSEVTSRNSASPSPAIVSVSMTAVAVSTPSGDFAPVLESPSLTPRSSFVLVPSQSAFPSALGSTTPSVTLTFRPTPVSALVIPTPFETFQISVEATATPEPLFTPEMSHLQPSYGPGLTASPDIYLPTASSDPIIFPMPAPTEAVLESPSPGVVPGLDCPNQPPIVPDSSLLARTDNFQRVRMGIQVAGPNLTSSCDLTDVIAQQFINLSAMNTLSNRNLWFITSIEDGPAVYDGESSLVLIEELEEVTEIELTLSTSPSPSQSLENSLEELYSGSVVFRVTAFLDPFSVELAIGAYIEYIQSQNIVRALAVTGYDEIQWIGMVSEPAVIDTRKAENIIVSSGISGGYIAGVAFGTVMILGAAVFIAAEARRPS